MGTAVRGLGAAPPYMRLNSAPEVETLAASVKDNGGVYIVPAFAGLFCPFPDRVRRAVTLDLNCRFTGQAAIGTRLVAEGRVVTAGRNDTVQTLAGRMAYGSAQLERLADTPHLTRILVGHGKTIAESPKQTLQAAARELAG